MENFPPSIFNAYNICKRQAWLMFHGLIADQDSMLLEIGRLIDYNSFKKEKRRIYIAEIEANIDMITRKNDCYYIVEIKKSSRTLNNGILQLKYYLYLLESKMGFKAKGMIKIPAEKISREVVLTRKDKEKIEQILKEMSMVLRSETPPRLKSKLPICRKCAHFEFCWS